jgi:hypothetical protein
MQGLGPEMTRRIGVGLSLLLLGPFRFLVRGRVSGRKLTGEEKRKEKGSEAYEYIYETAIGLKYFLRQVGLARYMG